MGSPAMKRILESAWYNAPMEPALPKRLNEFPKAIRTKQGKYLIMCSGVHGTEEVTHEQLMQLAESGILILWDDGSIYKDV